MTTRIRHRIGARAGTVVATAVTFVGLAGLFANSWAAAVAVRPATRTVVVSTAKSPQLGTFLVSGKTLYTVNKRDCTGECLKIWPPLVLPKGVTHATAGAGVSSAKLATVSGPGAARQVTYGGKALYFFVEDTGKQVRGQHLTDRWGTWSVVVTAKPVAASGGSSATNTPATVPAATSSTAASSSSTVPSSSTTTSAPAATTTTTPRPTTTTVGSGGGVAF